MELLVVHIHLCDEFAIDELLDLFVVIHQVSWIFSHSGLCTFHSSGRQREVFLESPSVVEGIDVQYLPFGHLVIFSSKESKRSSVYTASAPSRFLKFSIFQKRERSKLVAISSSFSNRLISVSPLNLVGASKNDALGGGIWRLTVPVFFSIGVLFA